MDKYGGDIVTQLTTIFGNESLEATIQTAVEKALESNVEANDEVKTAAIQSALKKIENANLAWDQYKADVESKTKTADELSASYEHAKELTNSAVTNLQQVKSDYNLSADDFGTDVSLYTDSYGTESMTAASLAGQGGRDWHDNAYYEAQHYDPVKGYGGSYIKLPMYNNPQEINYSDANLETSWNTWTYTIYKYNAEDDTYDHETHWGRPSVDDVKDLPDFSVIEYTCGDEQLQKIKIGDAYYSLDYAFLSDGDEVVNLGMGESDISSNALGTTDFQGGATLINELGTEAIVTPSGTLTSLPAHTGIVPADLTKNLYDLGEIAPNLLQTIKVNNANSAGNTKVEDNSMSVDALNATFEVNNEFDFEKLMLQARQYVETTKNR